MVSRNLVVLLRTLALSILVNGWVPCALAAHGGGQIGPPRIDLPKPPPPDPGTEAPGQPPGPGGDRTPAPTPGKPSIPGPAGAPRPMGTPATGRRTASGGEGFDHWRYWWNANRERFFDEPVVDQAPETAEGFYLGRGGSDAIEHGPSPSREEILAVLERALKSDDFDTRSAALIAIGRVSEAPIWSPRLLPALRDPNRQVRESTGLALGILGTSNSVPILIDCLEDRPSARRIAARPGGLETRTRAFAAIGLALIGEPRALPDLIEIVESHGRFPSDDVPVAAVQALGLIGSSRAVPTLMKLLSDRSASQRLRAAAPTSLARLEDPNAGLELQKLLQRDDLDGLVLWSAILGTGRYWQGTADEAAVKRLARWLKDGNPQTRYFATISLGQVGGPLARRALLLSSLEASDQHQPWISLALAWLARQGEVDETLRSRLRRSFQEAPSADARSGHALALGLLRDTASSQRLRRALADTRDLQPRADLALALGLLGEVESVPTLEKLLANSINEPRVQWNAAIALRLLGARLDPERLEAIWKQARTGLHRGTTAVAFGMARQTGAIELLTQVVDDRREPDISRALATVALGLVGEKTWRTWPSRLIEDGNYRALADFQSELYTLY